MENLELKKKEDELTAEELTAVTLAGKVRTDIPDVEIIQVWIPVAAIDEDKKAIFHKLDISWLDNGEFLTAIVPVDALKHLGSAVKVFGVDVEPEGATRIFGYEDIDKLISKAK